MNGLKENIESLTIDNIIPIANNLAIRCECGEELVWELKEWKVNIVGIIEFTCPKCGNIIRTPGLQA